MAVASIPGALLIFIELGPGTNEDEFNDMYENEYVQHRLVVSQFTGLYRLKAIDDEKPTWGTLFSVSDIAVINSTWMAELVAKRSDREFRISNAYAGLDRRTYKLTYDSANDATAPKTGIEPVVIFIIGITTSNPDELHAYYNEEHLKMLSAIPGWARTRRYEFISGGIAGPLMDGKVASQYLSIAEFGSGASLLTDEFKAATSTARLFSKNITLFEKRLFLITGVLDDSEEQDTS